MNNSLNFPINYKYAYVIPGDYVVNTPPSVENMYYNSNVDFIKILFDTTQLYTTRNMFNSDKIKYILPFNTENVTDMESTFHNCSSLTAIPQLNTENVTNMRSTFYGCSSLTTIPQLNTENVTNMYYVFAYCSKITTIPQLNTENVTSMSDAFSGCLKLTTIPQLNTEKVTTMSYMFSNCTSLQSLPLLDCQNVSSMEYFFGYSTLNNIVDLGGFKDLGKKSVSGINGNFLNRAPNLTHESLMNVINNLYDRKSNGMSNLSVKFGTTNLDKLTDDEKAIAINKGWTLS